MTEKRSGVPPTNFNGIARPGRIFEILDEQPEPADREDAIPLRFPHGELNCAMWSLVTHRAVLF